MDDDVMDEQKYSVCLALCTPSALQNHLTNTSQSAALVLAKALVDQEQEMDSIYDDEHGHILPELPLHKARQVMTRADFIQSYDHDNIFTIDSRAMVRADSVPMQHAFRAICSEPGFEDHLEKTLTRIGDIESLGRTRELTIKDLWDQGKYRMVVRDNKGRESGTVEFSVKEKEGEEDD